MKRERLGQGAQHGDGLGVGAGQQHDSVGDAQQRTGRDGGGQLLAVQAEFGEPAGLGSTERRTGEVLAHGVHGGADGRGQGGAEAVGGVQPALAGVESGRRLG
ncbi:hypothetical protein ACFYZB_32375 [Streptomyces sp. NPDC001852]|uniref:hypothetical protein n=1 Tax=Streptomyces sp. NPDC001852 TaxID=3364619 RepID=UPI003680B1CC